jgi:hypothetical protein
VCLERLSKELWTNGETSVDHLQRQTDRPVPNEQHRESHSLKRGNLLELYTDSVFRYEPFGIFPVFFIPKPKGNSVGKFGIIKLAGALYTHMVNTHGRLLSARILPLALFEASAPRERSEDNNNKQQTTKSYEIRRGS